MKVINKYLNKVGKYLLRELKENTWFFVALLLIVAFILRIWKLGFIQEEIFDEVYFVRFAKNYISGTTFFDIHPPLGKLIIASAIKIFGDKYFAWRIIQAIFGTLVILLGYLIGKELKNKVTGLFVAVILALDGMILVYSRIGLMDIFMVAFIMAGFYAFLKFVNLSKNEKSGNKKIIFFLILAGIFLALAASIKYIAGLLALIYIFLIFVKKVEIKRYWWQILLFLIVIPAIIYLAFFGFNFKYDQQFISKVIEWHGQSLGYNINLKEGHPYGSKWWSWYLLIRPIWFYFKEVQGNYIGVVGLGNPLAWWASLIIIPTLIYYSIKKDKTALIILASFLILWLPWSLFRRVLFYYHAMPSFVFLAIGTGYLLDKIRSDKFGQVLIGVFFLILLFLFIFFLPIWIGLPINTHDFYHRIWLKGWI